MQKLRTKKSTPKYTTKLKENVKKLRSPYLQRSMRNAVKVQSKRSRDLHREVKELTGDKRSSKMRGNVRSKDGTLLFEKEQVLGRWNEHIGELFDDVRPFCIVR